MTERSSDTINTERERAPLTESDPLLPDETSTTSEDDDDEEKDVDEDDVEE